MTGPRTIATVFLAAFILAPFGGMEEHFTQLALALKDHGIEVVAFVQDLSEGDGYRAQLFAAGIPVVTIRPRRAASLWARLDALGRLRAMARRSPSRPVARRREEAGSRQLAAALVRRAREETPDVLHVHGIRGDAAWLLPLAAKLGIASVYTEHNNLASRPFRRRSQRRHELDDADVVTAVSREAAVMLQTLLAEPADIPLVRHIVPPNPSAGRRNASGPIEVIAAGRFVEDKGFDVLLRAMALLPPGPRLTLFGEGPARASYEALIRDGGIAGRVALPGAVPREALAVKLAGADIAVLPSRADALPIVLLECMAAGLPIVASRVGGIPDILEDGVDALLVPPEDPAAIARAIQHLADSPGERARLGVAARAKFDRLGFGKDRAVRETLALYERARDVHVRRSRAPRETG